MARLISRIKGLKEGEFFNTWAHNRFKNNKNILGVICGPTGSSKTYDSLSLCENYYKNILNKQFPIENVCFSLYAVAKRLQEGNLVKGEILILEEAGANLGNLDFQHKLAKMFTYILQSFRSRNIGLIMTLPVFTMLNKSARQLIHFHFITTTINFEKKIAKVKPFFHQLNSKTGVSYWKYPRVKIKGRKRKIKRLLFSIPSKELLIKYEIQKTKFVGGITQEFMDEFARLEEKRVMKESRNELDKGAQLDTYKMILKGMNVEQIATERGVCARTVYDTIKIIEKKGFECKISKISKENELFEVQTPTQPFLTIPRTVKSSNMRRLSLKRHITNLK